MNIREEAIVDLKVDDSDATTKWEENRQRIKDINTELRQLKEAGEKGSEGYKALQIELRDLKSEQKELKHNIDLSTASIDQMHAALDYWTKEAKKAEQGSEEWVAATKKIEEIKPVLTEARAELKSFGEEADKQPGFWDNFKASALGAFTGIGLFSLVKEAAGAIFDFGKDIFETTAKFEKYEAVLTNALGTHEAAGKAMEMIKNFAAETPFSVDELTESYVKYVNRGLQPTMREMTQLGDIAASQGKSFEQLTEAVLDAMTGENERLKEFGIQASKSGDEVTFAFKGVQQTVANTPEAIQGAILAFGELEGVQGGMAAISETLEGRVSNLGDNFDSLKLLLGDGLNPVFNGILDVMNWIIDTTKGLITESGPLVSVFESLWEVVQNVWESYKSLVNALFDTGDASITLRDVINTLSVALQAAGTVVMVALAAVEGMYDGLRALVDAGKQAANFFGADFKLDPSATFENMRENFMENMTSIKNGWSKTMNEVHINNMKDELDSVIEIEDNKLKAAKKRILEQETDEQTKLNKIQALNKEHDDKVSSQKMISLGQQAASRIDQINKTAKTEEERVAKTAKVTEELNRQLNLKVEDNHKKSSAAKGKVDTEADKTKKKLLDKQEKDEAALLKKVEDMQVKAIADDTKRAIAKADLDFKREQEAIKKSMASDATKKKALENAEKLHEANIAKINADAKTKQDKLDEVAKKKKDIADKKDLADEKKIKAQKLADTKKLLDDEFKAEVANAKIELALTKTNSQAMWDAKLRILQIETAHKNAKLAQEAAAEKARIAESIADNETKAAQLKAIDDKLTAEQRQNETQLQADKKQLQQEANAARQANNEAFYNALNAAMTGDFQAFTTFLQNKARDDGKHLNERSVAFAKYANDVGKVMLTTIEVLTKLNADYTQRQINNLTKEKETNFKKLDDELAKGIKTKEQVEAEKTRLQEEFDQKNLALKKKEFERNKKMQIAAALIQGSMAILSALATPPFPLGIALAIVAGVKTAFDITKIKNTKFEARSGGVFRNAGVAQGSRHGASYGQAGIAMYDRMTGAEVGEIEGGEPVMVLSRNTYKNNRPVIDRLLNSSLYNNGAPISMANGGVLTVSRARMFADGGVYESDGGGGSSGGGNYADNSSSASSDAIIAENKKMQEEMKKFQKETAANTAETAKVLKTHTGILRDIASKDNGSSGVLHALDRLKENMNKSKL
ncbi:tape measure protein [Lacihabitans soyangensis]|uniref:Tape measure protein N-terminal domain-containing protein n=1 Tax=Lacihabitans soyangensis TaxID=869394 RepID=A0AAE3KUJ5_9BACT|nr:tape measure protein [Lacihabitans soyangensis]MCP9765113.1 hypothetical protein [Lacihabitans soyangensis]